MEVGEGITNYGGVLMKSEEVPLVYPLYGFSRGLCL